VNRISSISGIGATKCVKSSSPANKQYDQIAKGVFQAWRHYSHVRRSITQAEIADDAYVMIFTLDWFLYMSRESQGEGPRRSDCAR
jgi:hypothetical protein